MGRTDSRSGRGLSGEDRRQSLDSYRLEDLDLKIVNIGSVGTGCLRLILRSPSRKPAGKPVFLMPKGRRRLDELSGTSILPARRAQNPELPWRIRQSLVYMLSVPDSSDGRAEASGFGMPARFLRCLQAMQPSDSLSSSAAYQQAICLMARAELLGRRLPVRIFK
jgi:hypothetical protein